MRFVCIDFIGCILVLLYIYVASESSVKIGIGIYTEQLVPKEAIRALQQL